MWFRLRDVAVHNAATNLGWEKQRHDGIPAFYLVPSGNLMFQIPSYVPTIRIDLSDSGDTKIPVVS